MHLAAGRDHSHGELVHHQHSPLDVLFVGRSSCSGLPGVRGCALEFYHLVHDLWNGKERRLVSVDVTSGNHLPRPGGTAQSQMSHRGFDMIFKGDFRGFDKVLRHFGKGFFLVNHALVEHFNNTTAVCFLF